MGGPAGRGACRRAGPSRPCPVERRPRRRPRGAASAGADGPRLPPGARHHAVPGGAGAAGAPGAASRAAGDRVVERATVRTTRRRRPGAWPPRASRGGPGRHAARHRAARRGQVRRARACRGTCSPARLAHRPGHRVGDGGPLALLVGARGARRPVPPASGAARRPRRQVPAGDRTRPVRAGRVLERRVRAPTALRGGRRTDAAGGRRPRAAARGGRHPGGGPGLAAPAALPLTLCRGRAGAARAGPSPPRARGSTGDGRQPGRPRIGQSGRARAAEPLRDAAAPRRTLPRARRGDGGAHLGCERRAAVLGARTGAAAGRRRSRGRAPGAAPGRAADVRARRPARLDVQHRRAARGLGRGRGRELPPPRGGTRGPARGAARQWVLLPPRAGPRVAGAPALAGRRGFRAIWWWRRS